MCAGLLWTAQGAIMMAYPEEKDKGRAFSLFWSVFTMGGVVGSAIALGIQAKKNMPETSTAVYVVFVILMLCAIVVAWLVLPASYIVRGDGTLVETKNSMGAREEIGNFLSQFKDWRMLGESTSSLPR
jgi:MFS family permease